MSCKICGRGACASWMHSLDEQEKLAERENMTDDVETLRREVQELRGEHSSETCCLCNWTNVRLLNLGEPGAPRWTCHGCCKRMLETLEKLRDGDLTGEQMKEVIKDAIEQLRKATV